MGKINKKGCIENADICIRCEVVYETSKGNGLRGCICKKCWKKLKEKFDHWEKYGLFIGNISLGDRDDDICNLAKELNNLTKQEG